MMSNKTYDILKFLALLILPIGTLVASLANIWEVPFAGQLEATFKALDIFAGALVVIAKQIYEKSKEEENG